MDAFTTDMCDFHSGTLPCQGSFILTPGTAAIPRELSLNPQQLLPSSVLSVPIPREISLNPQQGPGPSLSPTGFEFARNFTAAHIGTAKLGQPQQSACQVVGVLASSPRVQTQAQSNASAEASLAWACQDAKPDSGPESDKVQGLSGAKASRSSPEQLPVRSPRTSVEDLTHMNSRLNQLEQQLVQMPRPASRGLHSRPHTAESDIANQRNRQTPLHVHLQQPGVAAFGQPNSLQVNNDAISFLRPGSRNASQHSQRLEGCAVEEEDQSNRPLSAGSVVSQPQLAVLKARANARRQRG